VGTPLTRVRPTRTTVVWVPEWSVVAVGRAPDEPVAVLRANRVVAASPAAQVEGVAHGQRRREAQSRCPTLIVADHDPSLDARTFEPVVAAVETVTPLIDVVRPGLCAFATRGPSRYHGGDLPMMRLVEQRVSEVLGDRGTVRIGTADGPFAARLAAHRAARFPGHPATRSDQRSGRVIPPGGSAAFLAPLPVATLDRPELTSVLERLGLVTLGQLAALDARDVLARFGTEGLAAHRLASGLDEHPPDARPVPPSFEVATELDPPAERVHQVAFVAKTLADQLHARLDAMGLACTRLVIGAETEHGEHLERRWRHDGALTAAAIAERVRWQLDGWLNGSAATRPTGGVSRLVLAPDEVRMASGRQLGFWGGQSAEGERAARALARVQAVLGPGSVQVPERRGGREPVDQVVAVPADGLDLAEPRRLDGHPSVAAPWPGRLPSPAPAVVHAAPVPVEVLDHTGRRVGVDGRGALTATPHTLVRDGTPLLVVAWAGPWPLDERWWDPPARRRMARFQMVDTDGVARVVALEDGRWWITAEYG
jgi:protein ImuB